MLCCSVLFCAVLCSACTPVEWWKLRERSEERTEHNSISTSVYASRSLYSCVGLVSFFFLPSLSLSLSHSLFLYSTHRVSLVRSFARCCFTLTSWQFTVLNNICERVSLCVSRVFSACTKCISTVTIITLRENTASTVQCNSREKYWEKCWIHIKQH